MKKSLKIKTPIVFPFLCTLLKVNGITLFYPIVNRKKENKEDLKWWQLANHESIHYYQYKDLWFIGFLPLYIYYNFKYGYIDNPFEREVYIHEENLFYLDYRKKNSWKRYIKKK